MDTFKILIEELTDENSHTDALIVEALEFEEYDFISELAQIAKEHMIQGHLTAELNSRRSKIAKALKVIREA